MTGPELLALYEWIVARREGLRMRAEGWAYDPKRIRVWPDGRAAGELIRAEPDGAAAETLARFEADIERYGKHATGLERVRREWSASLTLGAQWAPPAKVLRDAVLAWGDDLAYELLGGSEDSSAYEALAALSRKPIAEVRDVLAHRGTLRMLAEEYRRHTAHEVVGVLFGVSASTVRDARDVRKAR